jgi:trehalose-6-phosphate synthase
MRLSLRLISALIFGVVLVSLLFSYLRVRDEKQALRADLRMRAALLAESLQEGVQPLLEHHAELGLQRMVDRFGDREHLTGIAVYDAKGAIAAKTRGLEPILAAHPETLARATTTQQGYGEFIRDAGTPMHIYVLPLQREGVLVGSLVIVHDATYIQDQSATIWRSTLLHVAAQVLLIVFITLLIVQVSVVKPITDVVQRMRALRLGQSSEPVAFPKEELLRPLTREMQHFARSLEDARSSAEREASLRNAAASVWTAERLSVHVRGTLKNSRLFVIANREPYMHSRQGKNVEVIVPASGLVTALEPILRACDGTWIAHGSGSADREVVDERNHIRVPPEHQQYTLRRVWLTRPEEEGYYYGFANEGLWPLCHIAHTRPIFRASDWKYYQQVNRLFAEAALEEMANIENPALLVQDYHFALLPRYIKERRPDARVAIFWHIPWPNPEAFGICPWQRELLDGLLGADLIGFHIQSHCNNFLYTVDRALESRIEWERFTVNRNKHISAVRPFPISVDIAEAPEPTNGFVQSFPEREAVLKELGAPCEYLGVGVDRVDYTKGILERFRGIERFLEKYQLYQGKFVFVQIGAPSRMDLKRYQDLYAEVEREAERINNRLRIGKWQPIVLLKRHHSHQEIERYYKAADLCLVTSLHDGMNLVAKEFLAARSDAQGVLILSLFAGASYELRDALIVNPYDTEQLAESIFRALTMASQEKRERMQRMRRSVKENNIYRWAGNLITELSEVRLDLQEPVKMPPRAAALRGA